MQGVEMQSLHVHRFNAVVEPAQLGYVQLTRWGNNLRNPFSARLRKVPAHCQVNHGLSARGNADAVRAEDVKLPVRQGCEAWVLSQRRGPKARRLPMMQPALLQKRRACWDGH